jgi:hypothetical protein
VELTPKENLERAPAGFGDVLDVRRKQIRHASMLFGFISPSGLMASLARPSNRPVAGNRSTHARCLQML